MLEEILCLSSEACWDRCDSKKNQPVQVSFSWKQLHFLYLNKHLSSRESPLTLAVFVFLIAPLAGGSVSNQSELSLQLDLQTSPLKRIYCKYLPSVKQGWLWMRLGGEMLSTHWASVCWEGLRGWNPQGWFLGEPRAEHAEFGVPRTKSIFL